MKKLLLFIVLLISAGVSAQHIRVVDSSWVHEIRNNKSDTLYIINFWATWCKPCVEELPYFEKLGETYRSEKIKILLVSTDMRKELNGRLKDFVNTRQLKQQVLFMNEVNADKWIDLVNPQWSGAIPATWMVRGSQGLNQFKEGEFTEEELNGLVKQLIKDQSK
jgi:thiol-disulfide isomerase/thioredoxin